MEKKCMDRKTIQTVDAPQAIGAYSQAIRTGNTVIRES